MVEFSIIICSYNPDQNSFDRLLKSLQAIPWQHTVAEVIIVDNNSRPRLADLPYVRQYLKLALNARIIVESKAGLTAARLAGLKAARYDWVVFFDDDNQPNPDYLLNAEKLITDYPKVACWGAGGIRVNYLAEDYDPWLDNKKEMFQERDVNETLVFNKVHWQKEYPQGTGLVCRKDVLLKYEELISAGKLSLTDRKGKSLTSGGDVQIVLLAVKLGYFVGISGFLRLQHNIDKTKLNFQYLLRLQFGTASSYVKAFNQVNDELPIPFHGISTGGVIKMIVGHFRFFKIQAFSKDALLKFSGRIGEVNAMYVAYPEKKPPYLLHRISFFLR